MPEAETDYFEIAKMLTREQAVLGADRYLLHDGGIEHARCIVRSLVDQVIHMAQVGHQAYHGDDNPKCWNECEKAFCSDAAKLMASLSVGHGIDMRISTVRRERDQAREWAENLEVVILSLKHVSALGAMAPFQKVVNIIEEARKS